MTWTQASSDSQDRGAVRQGDVGEVLGYSTAAADAGVRVRFPSYTRAGVPEEQLRKRTHYMLSMRVPVVLGTEGAAEAPICNWPWFKGDVLCEALRTVFTAGTDPLGVPIATEVPHEPRVGSTELLFCLKVATVPALFKLRDSLLHGVLLKDLAHALKACKLGYDAKRSGEMLSARPPPLDRSLTPFRTAHIRDLPLCLLCAYCIIITRFSRITRNKARVE